MKEIEFKKVGATNFKNYKDLIEYSFITGKLNLITGPNGIGKTTIFDILPFTLYGITPSGLRSDDVVNNEVGKNCHTFCEFVINEDLYKVNRYVKHSKFGDTVLISKNDEKPYKKGHREVLPEIENLIGPQKLFMNTVLFGQKVKNFFTDLNDSEQKEIFRKVLQLDDYVLYYDETSKKIKETNQDIIMQSNEISNLKNMVDKFSEQMTLILAEKEKFKTNKQSKIVSIEERINYVQSNYDKLVLDMKKISEDLETKISEYKIEYQTKKAEYDKIEENIKEQIESISTKAKYKASELNTIAANMKTEALQKKQSELETLIEKEENIRNITNSINDGNYKITNINNEVKSEEKKANQLKIDIKNLNDSLNEDKPICYVCKQEIGMKETRIIKDLLKTKESDLQQLNTSIENLKLSIGEIDESNKKLKTNYDELFLEIKTLKNQIEETYQNQISNINTKLNDSMVKVKMFVSENIDSINKEGEEKKIEIQTTLTQLNSLMKTNEDLVITKQNLNNEISEKTVELSNLKLSLSLAEKETYDDTIFHNTKETLDSTEIKLKELSSDLKIIVEEKKILDFWKTAFSSSGIPSMLIDEAIPEMNRRVKSYLEEMGGRYIVSFDTQSETKGGDVRDKISVNVLDTITKSNKRKGFSGGQVRIVDIAVLLTLSDIQSMIQNVKTNLMLLDEVFDSLDEENVSYVSKILRILCKEKSINIISHSVIDQLEADQIFKLG